MTDRDKVIKGLEKCKRHECDDCTEKGASQAPWDCPAYDNFVDSALALLKEQEAVKPIRMNHSERASFDNYLCECKNDLYYKQKFCDECGRAVKWDADGA